MSIQDAKAKKENEIVMDYANIRKRSWRINKYKEVVLTAIYDNGRTEKVAVGEIREEITREEEEKLIQDLDNQMGKIIQVHQVGFSEEKIIEAVHENLYKQSNFWELYENRNSQKFAMTHEGVDILENAEEKIETGRLIREDGIQELDSEIIVDYQKIIQEKKYVLQFIENRRGENVITMFWQTKDLNGLENMPLGIYNGDHSKMGSIIPAMEIYLKQYMNKSGKNPELMPEAYRENITFPFDKSKTLTPTKEIREAFKEICKEPQKTIKRYTDLAITEEDMGEVVKKMTQKNRQQEERMSVKDKYRVIDNATPNHRGHVSGDQILDQKVLMEMLKGTSIDVDAMSNEEIRMVMKQKKKIIDQARKADLYLTVTNEVKEPLQEGQKQVEVLTYESLFVKYFYEEQGALSVKKIRTPNQTEEHEALDQEQERLYQDAKNYYVFRRKEDTTQREINNQQIEIDQFRSQIAKQSEEAIYLKASFQEKEKRQIMAEITDLNNQLKEKERRIKELESTKNQQEIDKYNHLAGCLRVKIGEYENNCRYLLNRYNEIAKKNGYELYHFEGEHVEKSEEKMQEAK